MAIDPTAPAPTPPAISPVNNRFRMACEPHAGDECPLCQQGRLDYDGLLNLACGRCGYTLSGGFT
jgi:hypothetical protein